MTKQHIFYILTGLILLVSCQTEFSVNGEYQERAVVHCLLDPNEEYHYLKLNKTFLGDGNAQEFAAVPDSSYFNQVDAVIEEVISGNVVRSWTLQDTIIENKVPGMFYYPEQKLYYFKANDLDQNAIYRLNINIENGRHIVTGQTELVQDINITFPNQNQQIGFAEANVPANGYRTQSFSFSKGTGVVFKAKLRFDYVETTPSGSVLKSLLWNLGSLDGDDLISTTGTFSASGEQFYELCRNSIPVDPNVTRRTPEAFEIIITAGSEDLHTYMLVNEPTSSLAQTKPTFSNVNGGIGIFSARTSVSQYKPVQDPSNPNIRALSVNSTRELCEGAYTFNLGFCSDHVNDIAQGYSFACN
ncbi:MAG: DUF4249 family protein [Brumimicrobium sp.]|nr:DUF4249 family protein [Brumimicrobium sp.]